MMCRDRHSAVVRVRVAADLSHTGKRRWKRVAVDRCIAPIVRALQKGGIDMRHSCCGHGGPYGDIVLQDGRVLLVLPKPPRRRKRAKRPR